MEPPIFIVGCGRTGSKVPYQILNNHPEIGLGLEMHILNPWYRIWTSDLMTELNKVGNLDDDKNAKEIIDICLDKKIKGVFWSKGKKSFNIEKIKDEFLNSQRTYKDLFEIVLKENARIKNAKISGSKFPLHFYYTSKLKEWFPNSKIIHIIRDPRAILCSELNKAEKPKYPISRSIPSLYHAGILSYVVVQWAWAVDCHQKYVEKYPKTYKLLKFEDIISNPVRETKELCKFLDIQFYDDMLNIRVIDSSFDVNDKKGFDKESIDRWKNIISSRKKALLEFFLKHKMRKLGYM